MSAASEQLLYADDILRVTRAAMPEPPVVRVIGEIDITNSAELLRTLDRVWRASGELIVDVGQVTFVAVAGIRALAAIAGDGHARIRNVPRQMRRLILLMDLPPFA
ncbi:STAS domain-containing protein [Nonomuraea sp. H19]|uniref:STAS domain-containing protein n=1 Tax=Nonomuraea sp. H19 TaxID=3452206 RepID=UPI003F88A507